MDLQKALTVLGIGFQLWGAGYAVWMSRKTAKLMESFPDFTFNNMGPYLLALRAEMSGQYQTQRVGFAWIAAGAALQLFVAICD